MTLGAPMKFAVVEQPLGAAAHVACGASADVLGEIAGRTINLVLWQRRLSDALSAALESLDLSDVEFLRFEADADQVEHEIRLGLAEAGIGRDDAVAVLAQDIGFLARSFAEIMNVHAVEVRLEHVISDACRRFHSDYVTARMITTYWGQGTHWLDTEAAARLEAGTQPVPADIRQLAAGEVGIFKGRKWPGATGIVHRSPPIEASGEARLLLVIDPAKSC